MYGYREEKKNSIKNIKKINRSSPFELHTYNFILSKFMITTTTTSRPNKKNKQNSKNQAITHRKKEKFFRGKQKKIGKYRDFFNTWTTDR